MGGNLADRRPGSATTLRHGNFDDITYTVKWDPAITNRVLPNWLYLTEKPAFFDAGSGYTWPSSGSSGSKQALRAVGEGALRRRSGIVEALTAGWPQLYNNTCRLPG